MSKRFEALDAFRGLCALAVVIYHLKLTDSISELAFFDSSYLFVEFFFVLSGFVLTHKYGEINNLDFKSFIKSRFLRIYPLHFIMFLFFIILEFGKLLAYKYMGLVFSYEPFTYKFAVNEMLPNLLLIQSWMPFSNALSFNAPAWSISIEFYVYIIFYFTLSLFKSRAGSVWLVISLVALLLIFNDSKFILMEVLRGLSCFFGGAFFYLVYKYLVKYSLNYILGSSLEIILVIILLIFIQFEITFREVFLPIFFMLIVLLYSFESGIVSKFLKIKIFQYLGKLSYSIYMIHYAMIFCLVSVAMIIQNLIGVELTQFVNGVRYLNFGNMFINNLAVGVFLISVVCISQLTYTYIEVASKNIVNK